MMASIFGINPVSGGRPAREISKIEADSCMVGAMVVIFLICFEVFKFIKFSNMKRGTISEQ